MENYELDKPLDSKVELERHLPEWFVLLRKLVAEHLEDRSEDKTKPIEEAYGNALP